MSTDNSYESFLRERWLEVSQDAARAEAIVELILENEKRNPSLPKHLKGIIERFLARREERRQAAQQRLDAMEAKRDAERKEREG